MKYIAIGNCNKYNIYLLVSFFCQFFRAALFGINSANKEKPARIFPFRAKIKDHILLDNFIRLTAIFFGGVFLFIIEKNNEKKKKGIITMKDYEKMKIFLLKEKKDNTRLYLVIIGVLFSLYIILKEFIDLTGIHVGFWTIEILYICLLSNIIFKTPIYRHRKVAIGLMMVLAVVDFVGFFLPMTKHENLENMNELTDKNVFDITIIKFGTYVIPLLFFAYEIKNLQRDYCWIKAKYLMDVRSLPPSKIFIYIGSIGNIIVILFFSIFTYAPCKTFNNIEKIDNKYIYNNTGEPLELYKEYCSLKDYDENTKTLYLLYDSMKLISREYSNTDKENMLEIFVLIPLLFIAYFINEISRLMMVRYTDPNNILVYKNFFYFVERIIQIIINKGDEQYITYAQFVILELDELVSILSNMIYIEVIELKFCKLDYDLKKYITIRGRKDLLTDYDLTEEDTLIEVDLSHTESLEDRSSNKS